MTRDSRRKRRNEGENQPSPRIDQKKPPFWKAIIIQFLRRTSSFLETAAVQLETATPETAEEKRRFSWWERFLNQVRLFLPSSVSNNLSDLVLIGILAVIILGISWTGWNFLAGKPAEVATLPPVEDVSTPTVTATPETPTVEVTPTPEATPKAEPEPIPTPEVEPEPTPTPTLEVEPEPIPTPEAEPEPTPTPEPVIELTPEQALIVTIQNQVGEISNSFSVNLIKSIQANFRTNDLTIWVNDAWDTLEKSQQNKLAQEILQLSRQLDFTHLEIFDSQNQLIARSPSVGNTIIIFK
ncbi:MAG TPA: hypothetical protein VK184_25305 [Nostocaceae cyanobacterium]|nr:hypothetical protein [Nostocaceae cyanobacterium]